MALLELSSVFVAIIVVSMLGPLISANTSSKSSVPEPRFISFDSDGGKIDIDLDLSIPFLSIPLDNDAHSNGGPLLNVNTKAITVAGLMAAITAFVVPLFFNKTPHGERYRLNNDFQFSQMGNIVNELILGNNYVTPCVERAICTLVSRVSITDNPSTSSNMIIDGINSNKWFEEITNGTSIQEAISVGRKKNRDCSFVYNGCSIPGKIFDNLVGQFVNV